MSIYISYYYIVIFYFTMFLSPINSIFYSRYKVISEIKQISVKTSTQAIRFNKEQIEKIYTDLFLKHEKVTKKELENYLRQDSFFKNIGDFETSGYQGKDRFVSNMKSYIDFFGENIRKIISIKKIIF